MSKFSGRYDFYDYLHAHKFTDEDIKNNLYVYVGKNKTPLETRENPKFSKYFNLMWKELGNKGI